MTKLPWHLALVTHEAVLGPLPYDFTLTLDLALPGRVAAVERVASGWLGNRSRNDATCAPA